MKSDELSEDTGLALAALARQAIAQHLGAAPTTSVSDLGERLRSTPAALERRGVFVTLTIAGQLRGCIGTFGLDAPLLETVPRYAIHAAFHDQRFPPLSPEELPLIAVEVSILTEPRPLPHGSPDELLARLRPGVHGVILARGHHSATFLPQVWSQLPEAVDFLSHLCLKAGLTAHAWRDTAVEISTYQVRHFSDLPPSPQSR